jgi:AraC-like DNA-binding protein
MSNDPFSDVLWLAEARSVFSGSLSAGGTWALRFRLDGKIKFYVVVEGICWLRVEGREPLRVEPGDVFLLSGSEVFVVGGDPTAPARDFCPVFDDGGASATIGSRRECVLLVAVVSLHPSSAALFTRGFPPLVHVRAAAPDAAALRWMIERIEQERRADLPGADTISAQFAQILFSQVLRAHLMGAEALPPGWLRAIRDERIVRALRLIHEQPGRAWRLSDLSKEAGMSRARFAASFKSAAGIAPLAYLTEWRMHVAQKKLREGQSPIVEVAESLGYKSESAFSHAFKRVTGTGPQAYRSAEAQRTPANDDATGARAQAGDLTP